MNSTDAIVGSTVVITGTSLIRDTVKGKPQMRPVISGFLLGSALLLLSFAAPTLAKYLAYLGVLGALVTNGPEVVTALGRIGQ